MACHNTCMNKWWVGFGMLKTIWSQLRPTVLYNFQRKRYLAEHLQDGSGSRANGKLTFLSVLGPLLFLIYVNDLRNSWIPENIAELPLDQRTIQVMLLISTRKNYFCLYAHLRGNAFVIHHKLLQIIFYPHKGVLKSKIFRCGMQIC